MTFEEVAVENGWARLDRHYGLVWRAEEVCPSEVWDAAVAAERKRWESLARQALEVMENHRSEHAQSRISGVVYAFRQRLTEYGPNVANNRRP